MESGVRVFNNIQEVIKYVDNELTEYRKKLGELLRVIEELRARKEHEDKLKRLIESITGKAAEEAAREVTVKLEKITLSVNPSAATELSYFEELAEHINSKVTRLTAIKKDLEKLASIDIEARVVVFLHDGIPTALIIKTVP